MTHEPTPDEPLDVLRRVFGRQDFREGQLRVIQTLLEGRSSLAIFPTGGGKSLCYQLPALLLDGLTLVVSPLIALMKDQIDALTRLGIRASRLDSSLTPSEFRQVIASLKSGETKILYVSPERLGNERTLRTLASVSIALLAIDEAHCLSEWGHNFRPDYLRLPGLARSLKVARVLALTATATPGVADDVARAFGITEEDVVRTDFHRPNLDLRVMRTSADERLALLRDRIASRPRGATIVYVTLQKTAEDVAAFLASEGLPAEAYHAGLDAEVRHAIQERFMASTDAIIVATIAFGMGIDKADIRHVYHFNLPKGLESYAQEIGRAGRDGLPSTCELLACADDVVTLENFTYGDTPTPESLAALLKAIAGQEPTFDISIYELAGACDVRPLVVETALTYLELDGWIAATGPFFVEYKYRALRPQDQIVSGFDPARAEFLGQVFSQARQGRTWSTLDAQAASQALGEPRERILAALNYLADRGDLDLQAAGARKGYRRLRENLDSPALVESLAERFRDREAADLRRLRWVVEFAESPGCLTRGLLQYFGEDLSDDCGHCGRCLGEPAEPLPPPTLPSAFRQAGTWIDELRGERLPALGTPRQLARFLCGISSPAASRARLGGHRRFGALAGVPFAQVLERATASDVPVSSGRRGSAG